MGEIMALSRKQAYEMLIEGIENPENVGYVTHSGYVGNLAALIAGAIGENGEYAAVLGYLHDIGRKINSENHIYAGYKYLKENGYEEYAPICLTHSFLNNDIECICASFLPEDSEGYDIVKAFVETHEYTIYDKIIQVCDLLCLHTGGTTIEARIDDIESRRGTHYKSQYHRESAIAQKAELEKMIGHSIYDFYDKL